MSFISYFNISPHYIVHYTWCWENEIVVYFILTATGSRRLRVTAAPGPFAGSEQTELVATWPGKLPPLDLCPI